MKNPKVTVLMSVYNGEKYLREAIESILNQTFTDFEFLIVNDDSTDRTSEILQSYNDSRIKIINNRKNIGCTKSLNNGLKAARGEYIARMDADDISMPYRFEKQTHFLDTHADYAVVGTFLKIIDANSHFVRIHDLPKDDAEIRAYFRKDNCLAHGSVMIRKECLFIVGFYDETFEKSQDYELWLRVSEKYLLANIPEYLYMLRKHKESMEGKDREGQKRFVEMAKEKAQKRQLADILRRAKNDKTGIKHACSLVINMIAEKNESRLSKPLKAVFYIARLVTFKRIDPSRSCRVLTRIRFSRRINGILKEFRAGEISIEDAKLKLKNIVEGISS